jgi:Arylsulfotransferase (ASST)
MKKNNFLAILLGLSFILLLAACSSATLAKQLAPQYYSPLQNAEYVSTGATIAVRYGPSLNDQNLAQVNFGVQGAKSGAHTGQVILADDHKTVIFKPGQPFTPGEQVKVNISGLDLDAQHNYRPLTYTFNVAANQQPGSVGNSNSVPSSPPKSAFPDFLTVPQDIPQYVVTGTVTNTIEGDIFVAPFYWTKSTVGSYLLILNGQGQLVYYQSVADALSAFDFKVQPNGLLSYFDQKNTTFYVMDSHYQVVNTYQAGNGYTADLHDLQLLPDGNALLMAYDAETIDMSKVVKTGKPDATVTGLIIQELDPSKNVIFEWRSWDHFAFTDSTSSLTDQKIDLVHGNALALANDGNLLLSSRNQSEITKINLQTGDIIWRFGGKASQFTLANGQPFAYQHDVRQLPNGDITVFDNQGTQDNPAASHAIEYQIDEKNKTATQVWEFTHTPPVFATFMGDTQRLSDGNTFLDWGAPSTADGYNWMTMSEVSSDGRNLFDLAFVQPYVSYRAFLFPWQGSPNTLPALAFKADASGITLGYSWNGATEVASYRLYGGNSPQSLSQIEEQAKTDFETQSHLTDLPGGECYFQVAALDKNGKELSRSKVISSDPVTCPSTS